MNKELKIEKRFYNNKINLWTNIFIDFTTFHGMDYFNAKIY